MSHQFTYGWEAIGRGGHCEPPHIGKLVRDLKDALEEHDRYIDLHECAGTEWTRSQMVAAEQRVSDLEYQLRQARLDHLEHPEFADWIDQRQTEEYALS